jgi:hypothetical protein
MFVVNNTIYDLHMSRRHEAELIFRLADPNDIIVFCFYKKDIDQLEDQEMKDAFNQRTIEITNFDYQLNKTDRINTWQWIKAKTIDELEEILKFDFFLYFCRVITEGNKIDQYKYSIIMNDSLTYNKSQYRALTINNKNIGTIKEFLCELIEEDGDI